MGTSFRSILWAFVSIALCYVMSSSAFADEYFLSPDGKDTNSGSIHSPWRSLSYAESRLSEGDTLILRGGTYNGQDVTINVPNVTFRAHSYYDETKDAFVTESPIINCNWNFPRASGYPSDYPDVLYMPIIRIKANNVTIDGITITKSRGVGIETNALNFVINNCKITYCQHIGISIKDVSGIENGLVENCIVKFCNYARDNNEYNTWSNIVCNIAVRGSHNTVRGCILAFSPTAGLEGRRDEYSVYENNIIYGNMLTQIHEAESNYCTIRNNLIYGTERPGVVNSDGYGTGIELMCELWYNGKNWDKGHEAYGNLIANTKIGIRIGWQKGQNSLYPNNSIDAFKIYNNTVIQPSSVNATAETNHSLSIMNGSNLGNGHVVKNNIFWQTNGVIAYGYVDNSKVDMGYNLWSKAPASSFRKSTDPTNRTGYPALAFEDYFAKTSGWNNLTSNSLSGNEFRLLPTATFAIDKGTNTPVISPKDKFLKLSTVNFPKRNFSYLLQNDHGEKWEIGAGVYEQGTAALISTEELTPPFLSIINN